MNRRGFLGWVMGGVSALLGCKTAKASSRKEAMRRTTRPSTIIDFSKECKPLSKEEVERINAEWQKEWVGPKDSKAFIIYGEHKIPIKDCGFIYIKAHPFTELGL